MAYAVQCEYIFIDVVSYFIYIINYSGSLVLQAAYMFVEADDAIVTRHLEAYQMWLFGWVMFCSSYGDSAPKQLLPMARAIAEADLEDIL